MRSSDRPTQGASFGADNESTPPHEDSPWIELVGGILLVGLRGAVGEPQLKRCKALILPWSESAVTLPILVDAQEATSAGAAHAPSPLLPSGTFGQNRRVALVLKEPTLRRRLRELFSEPGVELRVFVDDMDSAYAWLRAAADNTQSHKR